MCLILIALDKKPDFSILRKAWTKNDDGAGIIWMNKNRKAEYVKGIETLSELYTYVQSIELPFIIHFRLASVGGVNPLLTQPFEINKDSPLKVAGVCDRLLLHNGTESDYRKYLSACDVDIPLEKDGTTEQAMSDTRAIAMILARHRGYNFLDTASGKFVVIGYKSPTDECPFRYWGNFEEEDGIFYSNLFWKYATDFYQGKNYSNVHTHEDWRGVLEGGANEFGVNLSEQDKTKKKIEKYTSEIENIPVSHLPKVQKYKYLQWWKHTKNLQAIENLIKINEASKYPLMLPPNTVDSKVSRPPLSPAEEEQRFFGGCGAEFFNRGAFD